METRKCPNCGGGLELTRALNMLECPFCGSKFEVDAEDREKIAKERSSLDENIFRVERDFTDARRKKQVGKCIETLIYCMNELGTPERIEDHIRKSLMTTDDLAAEGINESLINAVRGRINGELTADERIIVYKDLGIFSKGKEFTVLTNKRFLFFKKKNCITSYHTDIGTLKLADGGDLAAWYINGDYNKQIPSMEPSGQLTGAAIALACLFSFDQQPDRDRIRLI
ncbi:MAG: hypothetical protein IJ784_07160 [Ruminiclostridium sp.]|nr:hypothetical protein [Ruminiclostridium sp.]